MWEDDPVQRHVRCWWREFRGMRGLLSPEVNQEAGREGGVFQVNSM